MNQLTDIAAKIEALPEDAILCVVPHEIRFAQADDLRGFDVDVPEIPHYPDVDVNDLKAIAAEVKRLTDENARLETLQPVSAYRDKLIEHICEDDFDFTKILTEIEYEGETYVDLSQEGSLALTNYFLNLMEMVNEWRSEDAGAKYDFLQGTGR